MGYKPVWQLSRDVYIGNKSFLPSQGRGLAPDVIWGKKNKKEEKGKKNGKLQLKGYNKC
jgi:hypothetical protein